MQDLCILIPTVNRKDLLMNALKIYSKLFPNITKLILDNGNQDIPCDDENTWIWQRRLDFPTTWIYILSPSEKEYNDMEVDILKTLTTNNRI